MDLFADDQQVYDAAMARIENVRKGAPFDFAEFVALAEEYGKLLKQLRRATRFADRTVMDLYESNLDLTDKVYYDALTGIYNRRFVEKSLARTIKSLSRSDCMLSVMLLDIDFFKQYNDTYGHSMGDACLKAIAETLTRYLPRESDFVARHGGEEFVVVLPHTDRQGAHLTAGRLLEGVLELDIPHEKNETTGCVTISIGFTTVKVKHTHKAEEYFKCADKALYASKQNGRNRYTYIEFMEDAHEV